MKLSFPRALELAYRYNKKRDSRGKQAAAPTTATGPVDGDDDEEDDDEEDGHGVTGRMRQGSGKGREAENPLEQPIRFVVIGSDASALTKKVYDGSKKSDAFQNEFNRVQTNMFPYSQAKGYETNPCASVSFLTNAQSKTAFAARSDSANPLTRAQRKQTCQSANEVDTYGVPRKTMGVALLGIEAAPTGNEDARNAEEGTEDFLHGYDSPAIGDQSDEEMMSPGAAARGSSSSSAGGHTAVPAAPQYLRVEDQAKLARVLRYFVAGKQYRTFVPHADETSGALFDAARRELALIVTHGEQMLNTAGIQDLMDSLRFLSNEGLAVMTAQAYDYSLATAAFKDPQVLGIDTRAELFSMLSDDESHLGVILDKIETKYASSAEAKQGIKQFLGMVFKKVRSPVLVVSPVRLRHSPTFKFGPLVVWSLM